MDSSEDYLWNRGLRQHEDGRKGISQCSLIFCNFHQHNDNQIEMKEAAKVFFLRELGIRIHCLGLFLSYSFERISLVHYTSFFWTYLSSMFLRWEINVQLFVLPRYLFLDPGARFGNNAMQKLNSVVFPTLFSLFKFSLTESVSSRKTLNLGPFRIARSMHQGQGFGLFAIGYLPSDITLF